MFRASLLSFTLLALLTFAAVLSAATHNVSISNFAFSPADLMVNVGDTVTWTNNDSYPHTVTATGGEFDSGNLGFGASFSHVFTIAGSFAYVCQYHSNMNGNVQAMAMGAPHEVLITNFAFDPVDLTIAVGDSVRWTNMDASPHTVTAGDGSFDSGMLSNGQSFTFVFSTAGTFPYVCQFHSNMSAVIYVGTPGGMTHEISIANFAFSPADLTISVGDTVRWTNNDAASHTATATDGSFDSGTLTTGQSFTHVFATQGDFSYVCQYHSNMTGVIHVGTTGGGGDTVWTELNSPTTLPLNDVRFWDENLGWAGGDQGILRTTDGGDSWTLTGTSDDVEAVFFASATEGWVCGNDGMLLHSANGGQSWSPQNSGAGDKIRDIWFADNMNGWACGRNGLLIHTTNGGQNWNPQSSPATDDLYAIHMLDAQNGWIAGKDGLILNTANGGSSWEIQLSAPNGEEDEFEGLFALDADHAWAAGHQGRIYSLTNGAWSPQASGTAVAIMDVFFTDNDNGWVCGAGGYLANTMDGGSMWHTQTPPAFASFNSVYFVNENLGFLVAGDGRIFRYTALPTAVTPRDEASVPQSVELLVNYPNPFNPATTIEFHVNAAGPVKLDIFDVLGQHVATLMDGPLNAGAHHAEFSGANLPSGMYFYQLRAADQILTRRMMLVK